MMITGTSLESSKQALELARRYGEDLKPSSGTTGPRTLS
jgi:hypothetical protein